MCYLQNNPLLQDFLVKENNTIYLFHFEKKNWKIREILSVWLSVCLSVCLPACLKKLILKRNQQTTKIMKYYPVCKGLNTSLTKCRLYCLSDWFTVTILHSDMVFWPCHSECIRVALGFDRCDLSVFHVWPLYQLHLLRHMLITFTNSLDLDQARHNVGPDLNPNCLVSWWYS